MERIDTPTTDDRLMGKSPKLTRETNQRVLFDSLLSQGPPVRPELARASGLSQSTVIVTLNELVDAQLVVSLGNDTRDTGRPAKLYQVNPAITSVIAVDVGRVWVHVAVVGITGDEFYRHNVRNVAGSATALVELISVKVSQAKAKLLLDPGRTYVVIGFPGAFVPRRGVVDYVDRLLGWHRLKLINMFNDELGAQLQIENDVNLAVLAGSIHGQARRHEPFIYFHIGTGAGLVVILNGKLHHGFHEAAGELTYLFTVTGVDGRVCAPEDVVSVHTLMASAREPGLVSLTPKAVPQLATMGDPTARQAMDRFVEGISAMMITINAVLDPECVVLGGGIGIRLQGYVVGISGAVTRRSPFYVNLEAATLCTDATLRGVVDMGLETICNAMFRLGVPDDLG